MQLDHGELTNLAAIVLGQEDQGIRVYVQVSFVHIHMIVPFLLHSYCYVLI